MSRKFFNGIAAALLLIAPVQADPLSTLSSWANLPALLHGRTVTMIMTDHTRVHARLLKNGPDAFSVEVSGGSNPKYRAGRHSVPYQEVAQIDATVRGRAVEDYFSAAVACPIELLSLDPAMWIVSPILLGWAAGGLASLPVAAPIVFLAGHSYHFRVNHG